MAAPKIRFKKDDGSDYPAWKEHRLKDVTTRITRKNKNNETDIPLTIASAKGLVDQRTYFGKTIASTDMSGYFLLHRGEYAYNKSYSNGYDFGAIKRLDVYDAGALSTLYICFSLNSDEDSNFYNCYFDSLRWYNQMREICAEGARNHGLLNVAASDFFNILLSVPSDNEEQQKIAEFLSDVDELINASEDEITKLTTLKKGMLQKMFPKQGEKVPEIRFPGFTSDWEQRKLGELVNIGDIDHRMPRTVSKGIPYLMTGDFCGFNELNFDNVKHISEEDYEQLSRKIKPEKGDILFARYASVGSVRYVDFTDRFLISYSCAIIKKGNKIDSKYLYHYLTSDAAQRQIKLEINTGTQANIGIESMKNKLQIMIPNSEEQGVITDYLDNLDNLITLHQQECDKYRELKKGLLQQMFI